MTKHLVIVESPAKAKTIQKYLGNDYEVLASYGHVRDLLPRQGSVDPSHQFAMTYSPIEKNARHIESIVKAVKKVDCLLLATDPDREGEAISWHVCELLKGRNLLKDKAGRFTLRSIYDGKVSHYTENELMVLINSLKPDAVILPPALSSDALALLSDAIKPCDESLVSDQSAKDALNGLIYDKDAMFSITAEDMATSFEPLSQDCACPACALGLTRAYFHHLYVHTPLLCYRFLIQHNHYVGNLG